MSDSELLYLLLGVALFAIVSVPVYQYSRARRRDIFEPVYLATFVFFMIFWVRSVYIIAFGSYLVGEQPFSTDIIASWNIAWLYLLLASSVFFLAYYSQVGLALGNALPTFPATWSRGKTYWCISVLLAVGVLSFLKLVEAYGDFATFLNRRQEVQLGTAYYDLLSYCASLAMLASYTVLVTRRKGRFFFRCLLLIALGIAAAKSLKSHFLFSVLSLLMIRHYLGKMGPSMTFRYLLGLVIGTSFAVFPIFIALGEPEGLAQSWASLEVTLLAGAVQSVERFSGMESLIYVIRDTPAVMNYQLGETYLYALVAWAPRSIWEGKPRGFVHAFTAEYLGHMFDPEVAAYGPTILGEAYVNFHVAGIIAIAALGGICLRAFYHWLIKRNLGLSGVFVYCAILPFIIITLESHATALLTPAFILLATSMMCLVLSVDKHH